MRAGADTINNRGVSAAPLKDAAALLARFFERPFGCRHKKMSRPVTLGGETYCACLYCGARRRFDAAGWHMRGPYYFFPELGGRSRRKESFTMSMKFRSVLLLVWLMLPAVWTTSDAQQLRDAFRKARQSVVIVRTKQIDLVPAPGQVMSVLDGLGSGVLISNDGKILTAAHVVQTADIARVEFPDGQVVNAHVIGSDIRADVAMLQLDNLPANLTPAPLGDSDKVDVGDQIFVIGAPYGLGQTLSAGHVSGRHQLDATPQSLAAVEFLQTDAAVNSGNSGSPVFTTDGEVVGIVSTIMSQSGGSEGLAFATTSNTAKHILLDRKPLWSGIDGLLVTGELAKALNLPQPAGVLVQRVAGGSIAARLGVRPGTLRANVAGADLLLGGDIILNVNGVPVTAADGGYDAILNSIGALKPGDALVVKVFRDGLFVKLSAPIQ